MCQVRFEPECERKGVCLLRPKRLRDKTTSGRISVGLQSVTGPYIIMHIEEDMGSVNPTYAKPTYALWEETLWE